MRALIYTALAVALATIAIVYKRMDSSSSVAPLPREDVGLSKYLAVHNLSHSSRIWIVPDFLAPDEVHVYHMLLQSNINSSKPHKFT